MKPAGPTPVVLLSGFLGSGKTTWLRRLLQTEAKERIALLINEFGEVGIDHLLVEPIAPDTVLLQSGCICCQIRGELKDAILTLLSRAHNGEIPGFDRIVIETTGLADPAQIRSTLMFDPVLRNQVVLEQVLVTVDAQNGVDVHAGQPEWSAQIAAADTLLISKSDLVPMKQVQHLRGTLADMNPFAVQRLSNEYVSLEAVQGRSVAVSGFSCLPAEWQTVAGTDTLSLTLVREIDWTRFVIWLSALIHCHGQNLLRVKCLLNTTTMGQILLDGVGHTLHPPQHPETSMAADEPSRLVFIARGLDLAKLRVSLETFVYGPRRSTGDIHDQHRAA